MTFLDLTFRVVGNEIEKFLFGLDVEGPDDVGGADALLLELSALDERQTAQQVAEVLHCQQEAKSAVVQRIRRHIFVAWTYFCRLDFPSIFLRNCLFCRVDCESFGKVGNAC
jgi:hypothetical protein